MPKSPAPPVAISSACSASRCAMLNQKMLKRYFRYVSFLFVGIHISCAMAGSYEDFFVAVANDDEVTVNALLTRGFDPNTVGPQGQMPLYAALQKGSSKVAEALWHHPALQVDVANVN